MARLIDHPRAPYALLALTCLLGWLFKGHCGAGWVDSEQYLTGCYSDAIPFWSRRGVELGQIPYFQARMEYPVLTGALTWIEGSIARAIGGAQADAADFLLVVSAVNAALAFVVLRLFERAGVDRQRLGLWALAPVLLLYLGHNWDMLAVAFAVAALLAAREARDLRAAALAALGGAAKLFPLLMLPLIGLAALVRGDRPWPRRLVHALAVTAVAIVAWGAVNLPVAALAFTNWSEFYTFSQDRGGTAASLWDIANTQGWWVTDTPTRNAYGLAFFAIGAVAISLAGWRRHGSARLWLMFTPVLAWFMLTNKVYSPQFDLWLYPFLLLTCRRLWPVACFALGDVVAYFAEFWWFATVEGAGPGVTLEHVAIAAAFRAGAMLWIIGAALVEPAPDWTERRERA